MKFSVGDHVRIRQWDDMAEEFGVADSGDIKCPLYFTTEMRHLCGRVATITGFGNGRNYGDGLVYLEFEDDVTDTNWDYSIPMLEPADSPLNDRLDEIIARVDTLESEIRVLRKLVRELGRRK